MPLSKILFHLDYNIVGADMSVTIDLTVPQSKIEGFSRDCGTKFDRVKSGIAGSCLTEIQQERTDTAERNDFIFSRIEIRISSTISGSSAGTAIRWVSSINSNSLLLPFGCKRSIRCCLTFKFD